MVLGFPGGRLGLAQNMHYPHWGIPGLRAVILLVAILCSLVARAESFDDFDPDLAKLPQFSPDECAKQSPDAMYARLEEQFNRLQPGPHPISGFYFSEGGRDTFYGTYAHQLRLKTDKAYPKVKDVRGPLVDSYELCLEYLLSVLDSGMGHERYREPARLEWMLYHGEQVKFDDEGFAGPDDYLSEANYWPEQIEAIGVAIGLSNVNPRVQPFETEMRPILKKCVARLEDAEEHMDDNEKRFFRRRLVLLMGRFL